ncbi:hypothetical protein PCANC_27638 [Puccinia coronata f. sp. avenae]|uniref:CCHC-type domain-containing protein n=1 Tax=Puccinia coronata f. sp. avenae TaxID=200324 RepID=A0A2N5S4E5_9BASI|nr:hypothetical protein PCANC_27638 [Puccinia coronata f. sp. avenae]
MAAQLEQINLRYRTTLRNSTKTRHQVKQVGRRINGLEGQMRNVLDAMTAISASVDCLNNCAPETTRQGTPFSTSAKPELRRRHPEFNGENFTAWQRQLNTTLEFVFHKDDFLNKNGWVLLNPNHKPSVTILLRSSINKILSTTVVGGKSPREIFKLIRDRCKRCDRQHKLNIINRLGDFLTAERQPSNALFLQRFQEFFVEIQQKHINVNELLGLILQSIVKPPALVDENAFRNNLAHRLNNLPETPSFNRVCQEITQVEGELMPGSSSTNPILVNHAQPMSNPSANRGRRPNQPASRPAATPFNGTPPTPAQMAEKGSNCNYCGRSGHWASNCRTLIRDVNSGKIKQPQTSNSAPATRTNPVNVRVCAIDTTANPSDTVLIDSGASACVSGDSPFFTLETRLTQPIPVLLASRKSSMCLTGIGSLRIPTPSGTIRIKRVYHHPSILYVILSLCQLSVLYSTKSGVYR